MRAVNPLAADLDHVLEHTGELWEEFRGKSLFITGGTGFFGCWLLESLLWANQELGLKASAVILTRDPNGFRARVPHLAFDPAITLYRGDVRSFEYPEGDFSHVIHAATPASATLNEEDPLTMLDAIIEGTRRVLDFAVRCGAGKFLLTSSGAVYGKQPANMTHMPESFMSAPDTMDARSSYAEGKRVAELLCAIYHKTHGLETKIARCFAFMGPYLPLNTHFAAGNFLRDHLQGGPIRVNGDGTPFRSYLYAADLIIWLWTILTKGKPCRPYNVGSHHDMTIRELASAVSALGSGMSVQVACKQIPGALIERYVPDTTRARTELALAENIPVSEALRRTLGQSFLRAGS